MEETFVMTSPHRSSAPLISICIPSYCGARTIGETINSVLAQTYTNIELLVVDDNSPDDTTKIVRQHSDPRIRLVVNKSNLGPQGNWNSCVQAAKGRYIKLLPQDDLITPECIALQAAVLEADSSENIGLVFGASRVISPSGRRLATRKYRSGTEGPIDGNEIIRQCIRSGTNLIGEPGNVLFRRDTALAIGGFDATYPYVIDLDYWFRLIHNKSGYYLATPLSAFRLSPQSWTAALGQRQFEDFRALAKKQTSTHRATASQYDLLRGIICSRLRNIARMAIYASVSKL